MLDHVDVALVAIFAIAFVEKRFSTQVRKLWICRPYLLHLTATSKISLQLIFLLLVLDDLPPFQCLCATCATSKMANPIARWCLTLGRNPAELYWISGPRAEDLHTNNCKQRMRHHPQTKMKTGFAFRLLSALASLLVIMLICNVGDTFQRPEYHCKVREGSCKQPFTSFIYLDFRFLNTAIFNG